MHLVRWRRRSLLLSLIALVVTTLVPSFGNAPVVQAASPAGTSKYVPITHVRLADTRLATRFGYKKIDARTIRVRAAGVGGIPANATAVVVTITTVASLGAGVVGAYPSDMTPPTDALLPLNVVVTGAGQRRSNMVTIRLSPTGTFDIRKTVATDLWVDVVGAYAPVAGPTADGRFVPLSGTRRAAASLSVAAKGTRAVNLAPTGVPASATAAVITITVERSHKGIWTTYANGRRRPATIDVSLDANGQTRSNQSIVPLNGIDSYIRLFSSDGGRVTVDVVGYYTGRTHPRSIDGQFVPRNPVRRLDTRVTHAIAPFGPSTFEFKVVTTTLPVQSFAANLYSTDSWDGGSVVTRPAGVNASASPAARLDTSRFKVATHFMGRSSSRGVAITVNKGAHLVVDLAGYFLGSRPTATIAAVRNPSIKPTPVVAVRWADAAGAHLSTVQTSASNTTNDMTRIADRGIAAAFNGWSTLAKRGNTMLFAHRTSRGGIFRYLNTMKAGQIFSLKGADGRWYNYRITRTGVTTPTFNNIASMSTPYPPVTAQLIACSRPDGTPTSLSYRIVVTGMLVGVTG